MDTNEANEVIYGGFDIDGWIEETAYELIFFEG